MSNKQLMRRLHRLGIRAKPVRNAALLDLAAELPAFALCRPLGIHIQSATRWTQYSGYSRSTYAAVLSRRQKGELRKSHSIAGPTNSHRPDSNAWSSPPSPPYADRDVLARQVACEEQLRRALADILDTWGTAPGTA
ncbi:MULTISPECIES: hypothetical protein [unclassified Streptomyces]|uniref:hypothetical protein n=1 Tax=unclassified Streptomyces TaxID=2593676 RepID=UPI00224C7CA2|nr:MULTISPECIES: hypothetical protein [unclassified Streptomyces]WTB52068.1 hypothetical protein OG832_02280 [Streptomyces sp. NBC_00826]WTH95042.1 hypothetical protein OIC43_41405 [Streptomyces sp. NBC_00825]WTI03776.1 hypothetical protein OHA23_41380 [Streptomyces sp. NBC_00822]MCX4869353.1 hypothetical protein [Streptomyces sp. NBC_00906]MCX4900592.1 hypothetical protein [Streptomyces sp. NBC_00892]